ncbi:hypothetical protein B0J18DRAFT_41489 [Chaetomium sp. MPI-SDFR-AT-0129]|nr:hypothetical protein B0J18DRAFT_41489 [Chaetomium sp. MPI-SDFR-AT-0129]
MVGLFHSVCRYCSVLDLRRWLQLESPGGPVIPLPGYQGFPSPVGSFLPLPLARRLAPHSKPRTCKPGNGRACQVSRDFAEERDMHGRHRKMLSLQFLPFVREPIDTSDGQNKHEWLSKHVALGSLIDKHHHLKATFWGIAVCVSSSSQPGYQQACTTFRLESTRLLEENKDLDSGLLDRATNHIRYSYSYMMIAQNSLPRRAPKRRFSQSYAA